MNEGLGLPPRAMQYRMTSYGISTDLAGNLVALTDNLMPGMLGFTAAITHAPYQRVKVTNQLLRKLLFSLVLVTLVPLLAQAAPTSSLSGNVIDNEEAALPGVTVILASDVLIGGQQFAITDGKGAFRFNLLPPGQYTLTTEFPGFLSVRAVLRVALDNEARVTIQMFPRELAVGLELCDVCWPIVSTSQVNSGESYNQEFLENASIGVSGRDYLSVIGNEAGSAGSGNVNVFGSLASDNVYLIDGLNTTDPITATFGTNFNFDAIREVSIQTSGFEAEFGQALGGVINLVTKSGGNEYIGALDARCRDQSFIENGEHYDRAVNTSSLRQFSATIGGPILLDRIWFFVSVQDVLSKVTPAEATVTRIFDGLDYLSKVTWQINDSHRAAFKISGDSAEIEAANASRFVLPGAERNQDQGGEIYQVDFYSVLTDSMLLNVQAGFNRGYLDSYPTSGDYDTPAWINDDTNIQFGNFRNAQFSTRDSDQYKASLSYFVDDSLQSHEFKAGAELRTLYFKGNSYMPGEMWFLVRGVQDPITNPDGTGNTDSDGDGYEDFELNVGGDEVFSTSKGNLMTFYVQAAWRPFSNLTVKPGFRLDAVDFTNDLNTEIADFDELQPRIGVAWDIMNDGKQVLRANWGRFMHPGSVALADAVNGRSFNASVYKGFEHFCVDPDRFEDTLCNREWLANRGDRGDESVTIDAQDNEHYWYHDNSQVRAVDPFETLDTLGVGHLEAQWKETFSVAFERQLGEATSIEVAYVKKNTRDLIEDVCNNDNWVWDESLPQGDLEDENTWTVAASCTGFVLTNVRGLRRDYEAMITKFEACYMDMHILGSYTYSKSRGNSSALANRAYASEGYDVFPVDYYNFYGYLNDDRRHRVKVQGYYHLPLDFTVGFDCFWSSAPALDYFGDCSNGGIVHEYCSGGHDIFLEPRGSRRGRSNYEVDLQVAKTFTFSDMSLEVIFVIDNAWGDERPTGYWEEEARPNQDEEAWGTVFAWTQPRRYELGVRFEFY